MKYLFVIASILILSACEPYAQSKSSYDTQMNTIHELAGCRTFKVSSEGAPIYVVRCPKMESVSVSVQGKNPIYTTTVMDGK